MTRNEFVTFQQTRQSKGKSSHKVGKSVTDPSYARTGRQLIFQPLNIEYRMKYPDGVPLNKDNPHQFNEYDKIYPDKHAAMTAAVKQISKTKAAAKAVHDQHAKSVEN